MKVNPRPFDYITEPNLRTYRLVLMNDDKANLTFVASTLIVVAPFVLMNKIVTTLAPTPAETALTPLGLTLEGSFAVGLHS